MRVDFGEKLGLTFCEFYDSFFELLDNGVKSKKFFDFIVALRHTLDALKRYNIKFDPPKY